MIVFNAHLEHGGKSALAEAAASPLKYVEATPPVDRTAPEAEAWEAAHAVPGLDPGTWRYDAEFGAFMRRDCYGLFSHENGWWVTLEGVARHAAANPFRLSTVHPD